MSHDIWSLSKSLKLDIEMAISAKKIMIQKTQYIVVVHVTIFFLPDHLHIFLYFFFTCMEIGKPFWETPHTYLRDLVIVKIQCDQGTAQCGNIKHQVEKLKFFSFVVLHLIPFPWEIEPPCERSSQYSNCFYIFLSV